MTALDLPACHWPMVILKQNIVMDNCRQLVEYNQFWLEESYCEHRSKAVKTIYIWANWHNFWRNIACSYDVNTKAQSYQWKQSEVPRPKKAREIILNVKVLIAFASRNMICGTIIHGFCIKIMHLVSHRSFLMIFWPKNTSSPRRNH